MSNICLYHRIKLHVVTDSMKDVDLEYDDIISIKIEDILSYYNDLLCCSSVHIKKDYLSAMSNGQLVSLKILDSHITWEDLNQLNAIRNYYSGL